MCLHGIEHEEAVPESVLCRGRAADVQQEAAGRLEGPVHRRVGRELLVAADESLAAARVASRLVFHEQLALEASQVLLSPLVTPNRAPEQLIQEALREECRKHLAGRCRA